jgi:hypothetical protein
MALKLAKELESGVSGNYHRIVQANLEMNSLSMEVVVALYKNQDKRDEGKQPLEQYRKTIENVVLADMDAQDPIAYAYNKIKALPEYDGAEDV